MREKVIHVETSIAFHSTLKISIIEFMKIKQKIIQNLPSNIKFTTLLFLVISSFASYSSTSRLKSSAGIGVGSVLLDEATFLNPASSAFYKIGAIYYQKTKVEPIDSETSKEYGTTTFVASDAKGKMAGSISYQKSDESEDSKNISLSLASIIGEKSATGVTYHYEDGEFKSKYLTFGITHAVNEMFTMGFVLNDPLRSKQDNSNAIIGLQYTYKEFITLMTDLGTDWKDRFDDKLIYGGALQFKIFDDLYIRGGLKIDNQKDLKTKGFGGSWSSPKFVFNLALSFKENQTTKTEEKESTFSVSYKF
jgi:hypothetical protein